MYQGLVCVAVVVLGLAACSNHQQAVSERVSVAQVQKSIAIGMPSSQVVEILGAPNIISTDAERREVWVYDKISSEVKKTMVGGVLSIVFGVSQYHHLSNQRTLTIIIKFDKHGLVRDFSYRNSSF